MVFLVVPLASQGLTVERRPPSLTGGGVSSPSGKAAEAVTYGADIRSSLSTFAEQIEHNERDSPGGLHS